MKNIKNKKHNTFNLSGEYGIGYTSNGYKFFFDKEDFNKIKDFCWYKGSKGYLLTNINGTSMRLHRLIMGKSKFQIDHINHLVYDNRKCNLRFCTNTQNSYNKGLQKNNTSSVTGVCWHKKANKWWARIQVNSKNISLGLFSNIKKAKKARQKAELRYFGEFSYKGD